MAIASTLEELIGQTPLMRLARLLPSWSGTLLAKLEFCNPSGAQSDRAARAMLDSALQSGALAPGGAVVEATSGNIAFSLAMLALPRGLRVLLVMPERVPATQVQLLRALGAEVELTPAEAGMRGAEQRATELAAALPALRLQQFANPAAALGAEALAEELWAATEGALDALVVAVGTGSTITGAGRRLKALSGGRVRVVGVQPAASPVLSGGAPQPHRLYGMGAPFVPINFDRAVVDELLDVEEDAVRAMLLRLFRREGLAAGPAGGAALVGAAQLAQRPAWAQARVAVLLPDRMERYRELPFWESSPAPLLMPTLPEE